jgi:hypothetical protein
MHSNQPHHSREGQRGDYPTSSRPHAPDVKSAPPHDDIALSKVLAESVRYLREAPLSSLPGATKEALVELGILERGRLFWSHLTTKSLIDISELFEVLPKECQELVFRTLLLVTRHFGDRAAATGISHLKQVASWFATNETNPGVGTTIAYRKLVLALLEENNLGLGMFKKESLREDLWQRFDRVAIDTKLRRYLASTTKSDQEALSAYLLLEGKPNDLPYLDTESFSNDRATARRNARVTALRTWKHALNFHRLSGETRRAGPSAEALIARFGQTTFEEFRFIHSSSTDRTPGRGYYLSGPKLDQLFFRWPATSKEYKASYAAYGRALAEFPESSFCFLRNAIIVHHPGIEYHLPVGRLQDGKREPYALYVENDHFSGGYDLGALVPWKVLRKRIAPCLQENRNDLQVPISDISNPGFNLESLAQASEREGLPVIKLANLSTVFGGSVSGYPKGSLPFFAWEQGTDQVEPWSFDLLGRLHYQWYLNAWTSNDSSNASAPQWRREAATARRVKLLAPLGNACHEVAGAAKGLFDLLDLFYARYDAWKCDLTPSHSPVPLMLGEALTWNALLTERRAAKGEYPVLCVANRYDWNEPLLPVFDTFSMRYMGAPSGTVSAETPVLEGAWNTHVRPLVTKSGTDGSYHESNATLLLVAREYVERELDAAGL